MSKHFTITIKVAYDETTLPEDMAVQLRNNVERTVECAELLDDTELSAVVDSWEVEVESK